MTLRDVLTTLPHLIGMLMCGAEQVQARKARISAFLPRDDASLPSFDDQKRGATPVRGPKVLAL